MSAKIDEILKQRRAAEQPEEAEPEGDKFYSILLLEGVQEHFFEVQFRSGLQTCFSYNDLTWFVHDPDSGCIDLEFGGIQVTVKGRGLMPIFNGVKAKRLAWVKEAAEPLQDHKGNDCFVEEITITPPSDFTADGEEAAQQ